MTHMIHQKLRKLSVLVALLKVTHVELDCERALMGLNHGEKKQGKLLNVTYCFGTIEFAKSYKVQFCQSHSCWYNSQSGVGKRAKTSLLVP